jgi:hypothetical protein
MGIRPFLFRPRRCLTSMLYDALTLVGLYDAVTFDS